MPFGLQPLHLVIIAIVAMLIFIPSRIPEVTKSLGKTFSEFRKGMRNEPDPTEIPNLKPVNYQASAPQPGYPPNTLESAVYCGLCGSPNPSAAHFCAKCGSPLTKMYPDQ
jgi:TatA/E family protein of Tat protein translocase